MVTRRSSGSHHISVKFTSCHDILGHRDAAFRPPGLAAVVRTPARSRAARPPSRPDSKRRLQLASRPRADRDHRGAPPDRCAGLPMTDEGNNSASRVVFNRDATVCRPVSTLAIDRMIASRAHASAVGLNAPAARRADPSARVAAVHARRRRWSRAGRCPRRRNLGAVAVISLL